ncbi:A2l zinc ribbon domain [Caudoviricetes sp.]|nr:A2l zinc ribbon domain [Caudoviricetes sp.]
MKQIHCKYCYSIIKSNANGDGYCCNNCRRLANK